MQKGPFARLWTDRKDEHNNIHLWIVDDERKSIPNMEGMSNRIEKEVHNYLTSGNHHKFLVRGSDLNKTHTLNLIKDAIHMAISRAMELTGGTDEHYSGIRKKSAEKVDWDPEVILQKYLRGGMDRVLVNYALEEGAVMVNLKNVKEKW